MAVNSRQNNLFAAEDWDVAYKAYSQVNLQAYDFDTIRTAMVNYIKTNFPENFNDYIESSEFIAIIELLAYMGQSIAFRMDVNTRENFLETAERQDSVYKLARQLGYNPKRNIGASGLLKVTSVSTNEPLVDSANRNIGNKTVTWNDANNPDAYEQFITIMNSAFGNVNRFSKPVKTGTLDNIVTDLYQISTPVSAPIAFKFKSNINGINRDFEIVNADFEDNDEFYEKHPDPTNDFGVIHRNDGLGLSSKNNGFFFMFKQGQLQQQDFIYEVPVENRFEDVTIEDINETDVYFQQLSEVTGLPNAKWQRIPNTVGQTLQFNTLAKDTSLLYAVQNLGPSGVRLQFADGNFASVPVGNFRFYYRTSDSERFTINPDDIGNVTTNIPYVNERGENYVISVTMRMQTSVNNSLPKETVAGIKERAPQAFYAQDRMVSAQDYQVLPQAKNVNIAKIKVTNKTHAGHSRFIDITDPTSTFQTTSVVADDGLLYKEDVTISNDFVIDKNNTAEEQIEKIFPNFLKTLELNDFVYSSFRTDWLAKQPNKFNLALLGITWQTLPKTVSSTTGYMTETVTQSGTIADLNNTNDALKIIQPGNLVKFVDPNDVTNYKWVKIVSIRDNGRRVSKSSNITGPFTLSESVKAGWKGVEIISTLRKLFYEAEATAISQRLNAKESFGIGYNPSRNYFYVIRNNDLSQDSVFDAGTAEDKSGNNRDKTWLMKFSYVPVDNLSYRYETEIRGIRYIFESYEKVRFYNVNQNRVIDSFTGLAKYDTIELSTLNTKDSSTETFEWTDTSGNGEGDSWYSVDVGQAFDSIPLKTRSTTFENVLVDYRSNFGLFGDGSSGSNTFVQNATISLGTDYDTSELNSNTNVIIANNTGVVHSIPKNLNIEFTNTTFGVNILNNTGDIEYKFQGNVFYAGANGEANGHITLSNVNVSAQTGIINVNDFRNNRHFAVDSSGIPSKDTFVITYTSNKEKLDAPIIWSAVGNFRYDDGYTDPRKIQVTPFNSTGDDSPDNPIQFTDFVGPNDIVLFEDITTFDGYTITRPVKSNILDLRREPGVNFNSLKTKIAGNSTGDATNDEGTVYDTDQYEFFLVKDDNVLTQFDNQIGRFHNKKVYSVESNKVYMMSYSSTNLNIVKHYESSIHSARIGKSFTQNMSNNNLEDVYFKWKHNVDNSVRIDPSISNVQELFVLTENYYNDVLTYLNVPGTPWPIEPTTTQLATEFKNLEDIKAASDQLIFRSGRFKLLFGTDAPSELQATFKVVRLPGSTLSDNEIKSRVIESVNRYFDIGNWDFGDTFYFTELSSYIHQQVGNAIGSIVIVPRKAGSVFGDLFQVKSDPDELFLSTASVDDILIVDKITKTNLKSPQAEGSFSTYENPTEDTGPYAINGYYPLYSTTAAAEFNGNGTYHVHEFFGKTFYMPDGVTNFHGNYVVEITDSVNNSTTSTNVTNNTIPTSANTNNSNGGSY